MSQRINLARVAPGAYRAMKAFNDYSHESGLEPMLLELVKLRASYINGCAYCIDMHSKDARAAGESEQRIYAVPVWRETPFFTPRERAALAWTEAVTEISKGISDELFRETSEHFTDVEVVNLTMAINAINAWNRLSISLQSSEVGSYQPSAHAAAAHA